MNRQICKERKEKVSDRQTDTDIQTDSNTQNWNRVKHIDRQLIRHAVRY